MPANPSNPHDAYFRHVLGRPADAACELRVALPKDITARIDWDRLHRQPGRFRLGGTALAPTRPAVPHPEPRRHS
ncbi:Rpn family recombination-promoting nuclease/putative transposase [Nocardia sp. NPDC003345]